MNSMNKSKCYRIRYTSEITIILNDYASFISNLMLILVYMTSDLLKFYHFFYIYMYNPSKFVI